MSQINGLPAAMALIGKLKSSGHLIDVYDLNRVSSVESGDAFFSKSDMEGFDEDFGLSYRNHLLAVFVDQELDTEELINLYPPFASHFIAGSFTPHLLFVNLVARSVMVVKLIGNGRVGSYLLPNEDADLEAFQELDHAGVICCLSESLANIAEADYRMVYTEVDEGHIQQADAEGPDEDGMYLVGTHGDDGEGITAEELAIAKSELEHKNNLLNDGLYEFRRAFPLRKIEFENFVQDY
jgi:hypothetical protein